MSSRWEIAHNEALRVVVAQNDTISDIDEKAMRSVRLTTLIVGVLIATIELEAVRPHPWLLAASLLLLICSMISAILVYDESDLYLGPEVEHLERITVEKGEPDLFAEQVLDIYAGLILENGESIRWNARLLRFTNSTLIGAILFAVAAWLF